MLHTLRQTITVAELIAKLSEFPDDMPVAYYWDYVCIDPVNLDAIVVRHKELRYSPTPILLLGVNCTGDDLA